MRNTLADLNNHLFEQLERLNDEDLKEDELKEEMDRAKTMTGVASKIIENGRLMLDAHKFNDNRNKIDDKVPRILVGDGK